MYLIKNNNDEIPLFMNLINEDILTYLLKNINEDIFKTNNNFGKETKNINILFAFCNKPNIFKTLLTHKYFNIDMLYMKDSKNNNLLSYCARNDILSLEALIKLYPNIKNIINSRNIQKKHYLTLLFENYNFKNIKEEQKIIKHILDNDFINEEMVENSDLNGNSLLYYCEHVDIIFKLIFESKYCNKDKIFKNKRSKDLLIEIVSNCKLIEYLLSTKYILDNSEIINKNFISILKVLVDYNDTKNLKLFLCSEIVSSKEFKLLEKINFIDNNNNTILDYVNQYSLKFLLDNNFISEKIFNHTNDNTLQNSNYFIKDIYNNNIEKVKIFGNNKLFNKKIFFSTYNDYENCLYYAYILLNIEIVDYILNHNLFSIDLLKIKNNYSQNLLMIIMCDKISENYNNKRVEIFDKILNSNFVTKDFFDYEDDNKLNIFKYACIYNLDFAKIIFNHKLFSKEHFLSLSKSNSTCLIYALKYNNDHPFLNELFSCKYISDDFINQISKTNLSVVSFIYKIEIDLLKKMFMFDIKKIYFILMI